MTDKEFNLLDESWIRVMTKEHKIVELSLMDLLIHSQEYADFAGELEQQDIAILRLGLATLHTIFSRYDVDGTPNKLTNAEMARKKMEKIMESWFLSRICYKTILGAIQGAFLAISSRKTILSGK